MTAENLLLFFRALACNPRSVGAIAPSGANLASLITSEITAASGPVLELGPGTGVFTEAMLERGVRESDLTLIECAAPVAPPALRVTAATIDGLMILLGSTVFLGIFRLATGALPLDHQALIAYAAGVFCVALSYKLVWCFANQDSCGMVAARLRLIDLDGNVPNRQRRLWRTAGSLLSLGAAGLGLIWTFADPDGLAWHDQISGTFPTFIEE